MSISKLGKTKESTMPATNIERQPTNEVVALLPDNGSFEPVPTERLRGVAKIAGAKVEYTLEQPADADDFTDEAPILLAHGYGGIKSAYQQLRTHIAQAGKPAITYRPARSMGLVGDLNPRNLFHPEELSGKAAWSVMRDVRDALGYEQFDLAGHSMGGRTIADIALLKPEHVRSAIFIASVGLDEQSVPRMIGRALHFLPKELPSVAGRAISNKQARIALESLHYIIRNPQRTLAEGLSAAAANLRAHIEELDEQGTPTAAIQFQDDVFFPFDSTRRASQDLFDVHHVYGNEKSNHLTPQVDPLGVSLAIRHVLDKLHVDAKKPLSLVA